MTKLLADNVPNTAITRKETNGKHLGASRILSNTLWTPFFLVCCNLFSYIFAILFATSQIYKASPLLIADRVSYFESLCFSMDSCLNFSRRGFLDKWVFDNPYVLRTERWNFANFTKLFERLRSLTASIASLVSWGDWRISRWKCPPWILKLGALFMLRTANEVNANARSLDICLIPLLLGFILSCHSRLT
jgi:hypothetical protein